MSSTAQESTLTFLKSLGLAASLPRFLSEPLRHCVDVPVELRIMSCYVREEDTERECYRRCGWYQKKWFQ
jgi:hypothetical protein